MDKKLAVITTEFLRDFSYRSFRELGVEKNCEFYYYHSFHDVGEVFASIPDDIQGVLVSGGFATQIIEKSFPDTSKVISSYDIDDAGIFRLFIQLMKDGPIDVSRVYVDFFDTMGLDLEEYLFTPPTVAFTDRLSYIQEMTVERLIATEDYCMQKHFTLWHENAIDISITRFSSIARTLKNNGLRSYFAYPSLEHMKNVYESAQQQMEIRFLQRNLPASIVITLPASEMIGSESFSAVQNKALKKALSAFSKKNSLGFVLQPILFGFEILTSRQVIRKLTNNYTSCSLQDYFSSVLDFPVCVGYGVGSSIYQARLNAIDANREMRLSSSGGSCLVTENNEMIMPLQGEQRIVVSRSSSSSINKVSKKSGLSPLTVEKIIAISKEFDQRRVTSQIVADKLSITRRSANRFLSSLVRTKAAKIVSSARPTTKGRPERVYQITFSE